MENINVLVREEKKTLACDLVVELEHIIYYYYFLNNYWYVSAFIKGRKRIKLSLNSF